ncbi:S1C family serine protease, partial [Calditrichota bacterium]
MRIYEDLKGRKEVDRDYWIGLQVRNVDRLIAISLRLPEIRGVVITDVEDGSPAAKAGLESPDVIIGINGVNVGDYRDMQSYLRNSDLRVGDKMKVKVIHDGKTSDKVLKLGKRP